MQCFLWSSFIYIFLLLCDIFINQLNYQKSKVCDKNGDPPRYNRASCTGMWDRAKEAVHQQATKQQKEDFKRAGKIEIVNSAERLACYNDEIRKNRGWCITRGSSSAQDWGFCSSSCAKIDHPIYPALDLRVSFSFEC